MNEQDIAEQVQGETFKFIQLTTLYAAPPKPREGMLVKADGVTWNPGSGAGVYARISGAWVKL